MSKLARHGSVSKCVEKYIGRRKAFPIVLFGRFIVSARRRRHRLPYCVDFKCPRSASTTSDSGNSSVAKKLIPLLVEKCVFGESVGVQLVLLKSHLVIPKRKYIKFGKSASDCRRSPLEEAITV